MGRRLLQSFVESRECSVQIESTWSIKAKKINLLKIKRAENDVMWSIIMSFSTRSHEQNERKRNDKRSREKSVSKIIFVLL
jgi:hypothetical protein